MLLIYKNNVCSIYSANAVHKQIHALLKGNYEDIYDVSTLILYILCIRNIYTDALKH